MAFQIQHRETECLLIVEGRGIFRKDAWLESKEVSSASKFATVDEAKAAAIEFGLTSDKYKIKKA